MRWWMAALSATCLVAAAGEARAADARWPDYQIIIWQKQTAARMSGLRRLGVTGGALIPNRERVDPAEIAAQLAPFAESGLRPYLENVATDFYAAYHRWTPEHPITWLFDEARRLHAADPADPRPFLRTPSLSDPAALAAIHDRLVATIRAFMPARPLYFSLGDETGIADLSANWDLDFSPVSLAAMRVWLAQRYDGIDALNAEWGTHFADWDAVRPMTTTAAMRQPDDNFAAWSDFKAWMDEAFSRAVRVGTAAVREGDPHALAAIEGAQVPGWGGYDYARLSGAVDVMEIYPGDANMEIAHALNPALIFLTTAFGGGADEQHAAWRALLGGSRGLVLWDEANALVDDAGAPGPLGFALQPLFAELRGAAAAAVMGATPLRAPVAILYSPTSFRTQWMLDHRAEGEAWTRRDAEAELADSPLRAAMRGMAGDLAHLGITPGWVSTEDVELGALAAGLRVLLLPHVLDLTDREAAAIRDFAQAGGIVLADIAPGTFDGHSRRRSRGDVVPWRQFDRTTLGALLSERGIEPPVRISHLDGSPLTDATVQAWESGKGRIVAVMRDSPGGAAEPVTVSWHGRAAATDLRRGVALGEVETTAGRLDGPGPFLLRLDR